MTDQTASTDSAMKITYLPCDKMRKICLEMGQDKHQEHYFEKLHNHFCSFAGQSQIMGHFETEFAKFEKKYFHDLGTPCKIAIDMNFPVSTRMMSALWLLSQNEKEE